MAKKKMAASRKKIMPKGKKKIRKVMEEFKEGSLTSGGSGKTVTKPKQAIAIALSEQRKVEKKRPVKKNKMKKRK